MALTALEPTEDGRFVAYALSRGGSDVQEIYVRDVESSTDLPDRLDWAKFTTISWLKDGSGFYYTRFPQPGTVPDGDEHYFCAVYFHRLGEPQPADRLVFDRPDRREVVFDARVAADDRWLVITAFEGSSDKSEVHLLYLTAPDRTPLPLFSGFDAAYTFIDSADGRLFFRTDRDAPLGHIIAVQSNAPALDPEVIVPEQADKLSTVLIAGDRLVASYLHDASDRSVCSGSTANRTARCRCRASDRFQAWTADRATRGSSSDSRRSHTRRPVSGSSSSLAIFCLSQPPNGGSTLPRT